MKSKIIKTSLIITTILLMIAGIYQLLKYEINIDNADEISKLLPLEPNTSTIIGNQANPNTYAYKTHTGMFEYDDSIQRGETWYPKDSRLKRYNSGREQISGDLPVISGYQIYCFDHNLYLIHSYNISYQDALSLRGETYTSSCGHARTPYSGKITPIIYREGQTNNLSPAQAYIVSKSSNFTTEKQEEIWREKENWTDKENSDYAKFDNQVRGKGLNPQDKTDINSVYVKVNQNTKEYTVGPFIVNYTNGTYGNVTFGGISNITAIGYNKAGNKVIENVKIDKIILKDKTTGTYGKVQTPDYFKPEYNANNPNSLNNNSKVDRTAQLYPASGQEFEVIVKESDLNKNLSEDNKVESISIKVEFKYMLADGKYTVLNGYKYTVRYSHAHDYDHQHTRRVYKGTTIVKDEKTGEDKVVKVYDYEPYDHYSCETTCYLSSSKNQPLMVADALRTLYHQELILAPNRIKLSMDLGGTVFEDVPAGKESLTDGVKGNNDRVIPNVKVTLYTSDGKIAKLLSNPNQSGITEEEIKHRINPTITDNDGNYLFKGLDPMKKYYVVFEYNGQTYLPTDYAKNGTSVSSMANAMANSVVNAKLTVSNNWKVTSKATESNTTRTNYDAKFAEIGSAPLNYVSSNSLGKLSRYTRKSGETAYFNEAYSQYELMGFVLDANGNYSRNANSALIDAFYKIENGNIVETNTLQEGLISQKIKEYIRNNKKYPTDIKVIYQSIAGNNTELWRKLQFIEDCKITSFTKPANTEKLDLYPVYNTFRINHSINNVQYKSAKETQNGNYDMTVQKINGVVYYPINPMQFFVNLGLWRRQQVDVALKKDVAFAATTINDKTEVYTYNKRNDISSQDKTQLAKLKDAYENLAFNGGSAEQIKAAYETYANYKTNVENTSYWQIQVRMRDYTNYYGTYNREIYPADYSYRNNNTNKTGKDLELYVTYRLVVRNNSQSILSQITEVVDYYDRDYKFRNDLSWVMYKTNSNNTADSEISFTEKEYNNIISNAKLPKEGKYRTISTSTQSMYGKTTQNSGMENTYDVVYVKGLENKKLASGEEAYIYLTFQVKKNNGAIILDEDNSLKQNYAELNGYKTYYRDGTKLPNGVTKSSNNVAGIIDYNSNPGNLLYSEIRNSKDEKNFENDTDRAKSIKVTLDNSAIRRANGITWEDQRTSKISNAIIGNGVRDNGEININNVTVELVEKLGNGAEYVWATTITGTGVGSKRDITTGQWKNYTYTKADGRYEFEDMIPGNYIIRFKYGHNKEMVLNKVSYNGQDFKSTVYQKDMNGRELAGYNERYYNIQAADSFGKNLSDAKDVWTRRQEVNNYSTSNVTNHKAEVLASPYTSKNDSLVNELITNTNMTAETAIIVVEGEYNRTETDGYNTASNGKDTYLNGNDVNGKYTLNNVDFGLTERPKAQLELNKKISSIKLTLANGNVLFDSTPTLHSGMKWTPGEAYAINTTSKTKMQNNKYNEYYNNDHRYALQGTVNDRVKEIFSRSGGIANKGFINIEMDEELMHGATIKVTYELTVTNVGETDYNSKDFYYKGVGTANIVTTSANTVIDYVANNLQFRSGDNNNIWSIAKTSEEGLSNTLNNSITKYNTIVKTQSLNKNLKPGESTTQNLVLSQLITKENADDDRTYNNIAEITNISNTVGRRMAYSIQGNQDPTTAPQEVDSYKAEEIIITPPTGIGEIVLYISIAVVVLAMLATGTLLIKKRVLKK